MVLSYNFEKIDNLSARDIQDLYKKYVNNGQVNLLSSFSPARLKVSHAEGQYIHLTDGRKISDFTAGIGVLNHGHNHARILDVRKRFQNEKRMEVHKNFLCPYVAALAQSVASVLPEPLSVSYFCNSGSEAVEGSLKMAFKSFGGKRIRVLSADISFHGKLLGVGGLTGSPETPFDFPTIPNVDQYKFNDFESLKSIVEQHMVNNKSQHYAIVVEPFNASNVQECSRDFLVSTRQLCSDLNIPLIFDEVYTGWAKTGDWFYFMNHNVVPDILAMSKSFGGGKASIAGYVTSPQIFNAAYGKDIDATLHSTTYNGFGEECVTALEAIQIIEDENLIDRAREIENHLKPKLIKLKESYGDWVVDVRGKGALLGIILNADINKFIDRLIDVVPFGVLDDPRFRRKLIASSVMHQLFENYGIMTYFGSNRDTPLIVAPTLMATDEDCDYFIKALKEIFSSSKSKSIYDFARFKFSRSYLDDVK